MKYFGIYANSGAVQTALNESALIKPYVAIVSGVVDYNSLARTGVWIEDSLGNEYSGTLSYNVYYFNFQKRADATFTLYEDGQVVTASSYGYTLRADCEGDYTDIETDEGQDYTVEDIDYFTGDYDSSTTVSVYLVYDLTDGSVIIVMGAEDCERYWGRKQDECGDEGRCWDGENHECNDCPTCEDEGLCGEYPNCYECPDCDDWENLGYSSYEDCTCQNYGENCEDPSPSESEEGDPCDDWEGNGYSSWEDCTCQNYGENCEDPNPSESEE